jgi:D-sedoheptulose 7-phosphate isomerase
MDKFINDYFSSYREFLKITSEMSNQLIALKEKIIKCSNLDGTCYYLGNGGSAAMASHVAVDFTKNAKIRSANFNEADLITCFANDFGYENWMKEALRMYSKKDDLVVLISSSGRSPNVVKAAKWCIKKKIELVTFTGMEFNNPLRSVNNLGLNFWLDSRAYNHIEMIHHIWLLAVVDMIIGKAEYPA